MPLDDYDPTILAAANQSNIDPKLLKSVLMVENPKGIPWLVNPQSGATGLGQFLASTAAERGVNPRDPTSSIYGAASYLSDLLDKHGSIDVALDHYGGKISPNHVYRNAVFDRYGRATVAGQGPAAEPAATPVPEITGVGLPPTGIAGVARPGGAQPQTPAPAAPKRVEAPAPQAAKADAGPQLSPEEEAILAGKPLPGAAPSTTGQPSPSLSPEEEQLYASAKPVAPPPPALPVPSGWFERNVSAPFAAADNPAMAQPPNNNFLGQPWLQSILAGAGQGVRDVGQTVGNVENYLGKQFPAYGALNRAIGYQDQSAATQAQTKAFEDQYSGDWLASGGRFGGNMLATGPVAPLARGVRIAGEALPAAARFVAPVAEWATGGAAQNMLTGGGATPEDWARDLATGGVGGAVLRTGLGAAGRYFGGPAMTAGKAIADRLGIDLSAGQKAGGIAKRVEDTTSILPGSGAARFAGEQRQQVAQVIGREAGIPGTVTQLDTTALNTARQNAGNAIGNAASRIDVPGNTSLLPDLSRVEGVAMQGGPTTEQAYHFKNISNEILNLMSNNRGVLAGKDLQRLLEQGGPLDTAIGHTGNSEVRNVGNGIREALLNAAATGGAGTKEALSDLAKARYQYKVIKTVEPAITKTPTGTEEMSLPALAGSIERNFGTTGTGPGHDMQDLAKLIRGPLATLPSSGTAERSLWQNLLLGAGELGGPVTAAGSFLAGIPHIAGPAAALTAAPMLAGRALRFGPGLGIAPLEWAQSAANPLLARTLGGNIGNRLLPGPQPQPAP